MQHANLKAEIRDLGTKQTLRLLRKGGMVPAVLYGRSAKPLSLKIDPRPLKQLLHSGASANTLIHLDVANAPEKKERVVLIKAVQYHPINNSWLHLDLLEIALDQAVTVKVPVHFEGKAKGVADGGIVEIQVRQLEVSCLPTAIPNFIAVDISNLGIGDSLHVSEVKVPEGVKVLDSATLNLVSVVVPAKEEEVKPVEAVPVEGAVAGAPAAAGAQPAAGAAPQAAPAKGDAKAAAAPAAAKKPEAPKK